MILINGNSKKHWLSQCLHINIQVLLEGELTLDRLTIMSEILINYLKSLTMGHLLWQHSKVSSCEEVLGGCLYCLFYWSSIQIKTMDILGSKDRCHFITAEKYLMMLQSKQAFPPIMWT